MLPHFQTERQADAAICFPGRPENVTFLISLLIPTFYIHWYYYEVCGLFSLDVSAQEAHSYGCKPPLVSYRSEPHGVCEARPNLKF